MAAAVQSVSVPVGTFKTFGEHGPMYEVIASAPPGRKGEMVRIRVLHSSETLDYPLADVLSDPLAS